MIVKVVFDINQEERWSVLIGNLKNVVKGIRELGSEYCLEVVIMGTAINGIKKLSGILKKEELEELVEKNIIFSFCNNTMKKYNVKNIIFSSTAAVYGEVKCDGLVYEDYPTAPINPYGASKLMAERVIIDAAKAYGINYSIFRYFNVGGAHEKYHIGQKGDGVTALIPIILQAAKGERERLSIYGDDYPTKDGTGIRDYIHVVDLVRAHIAALPALDKNISGIYNLGNGNGFSVLEMLNAAKKVTNVDIKSEVVEKREGDPASVVAASEKARDILGWKPEYTDVEKIIETAWNWYRSL